MDNELTLLIKIPKEFECHLYTDKFEDSLQRIKIDVKDSIYHKHKISGNYEIETIDMLIEAFKKSKEVLAFDPASIIMRD